LNLQLEQDTIFVSVPAYRDSETGKTILDAFQKARHPERIFVGVCQQNAPNDRDCMSLPGLKPYLAQVRIMRLTHFEAQGPMLARALIEQYLFQDEMFFLQIDSHTLFVPDWDELFIQQLLLCPSDRPILTTYPHSYDRLTRQIPAPELPTFLRMRGFHNRLGFTEQEKETFKKPPSQIYPSVAWAAGCSFTLGAAIREVPYDPFCPYVFVGEEMAMSARYWTHGWDFFTPQINLIYHITTREYRPLFWEQVYQQNCVVDEDVRLQRKILEREGVDRIRSLINGNLIDEYYGLGSRRSLSAWMDYMGLDLNSKAIEHRALQGLSPHHSTIERAEKWTQSYRRRSVFK
jgi:hypothetical protein